MLLERTKRHLVRSLLVLMTDNWRFFIMIKHESTAWGMMFHSARLSVICQSDCFLWFAMHMAVVCGFSCLLSCLCPVLLHGKTFKLFCFPSFDFERAWWRLIQKLVECTKFDIFVLANSFQMCLVRFKTDYFDGQAWHRCCAAELKPWMCEQRVVLQCLAETWSQVLYNACNWQVPTLKLCLFFWQYSKYRQQKRHSSKFWASICSHRLIICIM